MSIHSLSLPRFLSLGRHRGDPAPERVEGIYLQERTIGGGPHGSPIVSTGESKQLPAAEILAEMACAACDRSSAGLTVFIP